MIIIINYVFEFCFVCSFLEFQNSPNATKDLRTQIPQIADVEYLLSWMKKMLALVYMPQYMLCAVYIVAMISSLLDIVYKKRNRLQFITASFVSFTAKHENRLMLLCS